MTINFHDATRLIFVSIKYRKNCDLVKESRCLTLHSYNERSILCTVSQKRVTLKNLHSLMGMSGESMTKYAALIWN